MMEVMVVHLKILLAFTQQRKDGLEGRQLYIRLLYITIISIIIFFLNSIVSEGCFDILLLQDLVGLLCDLNTQKSIIKHNTNLRFQSLINQYVLEVIL